MTITSHGTGSHGSSQASSAAAPGSAKAIALLLDLIIAGVIPVVLAGMAELVFFVAGGARPGVVYWLLYTAAVLLFLLVFGVILFLRARSGTSPGMAVVGIRTVRDGGVKQTIKSRRGPRASAAQSAPQGGYAQHTDAGAGLQHSASTGQPSSVPQLAQGHQPQGQSYVPQGQGYQPSAQSYPSAPPYQQAPNLPSPAQQTGSQPSYSHFAPGSAPSAVSAPSAGAAPAPHHEPAAQPFTSSAGHESPQPAPRSAGRVSALSGIAAERSTEPSELNASVPKDSAVSSINRDAVQDLGQPLDRNPADAPHQGVNARVETANPERGAAQAAEAPTEVFALDDAPDRTRLMSASTSPAQEAASAAPAVAFHLVFENGDRYGVREAAVLGRGPAAADTAEAVAIADEGKSVSKTHARIEIGEHGVVVTDLGSTNGTTVTDPDGMVYPVVAHQATIVPEGWTLQLGDRSATVERAA